MYTFISVTQLEMHKRTSAHSEPKFECTDCGKKFYNSRHLKRHGNVHNENKVVMVCNYPNCGKECYTLDGFQKHKSSYPMASILVFNTN